MAVFSPIRLAGRSGAIILLLTAGLAGACSPQLDVRGHVPNPEALAEIRPGVQTREQVIEMLGSPSSTGTFDDERWYYVTSQTETLAFFDSDVVDQNVLVIAFDDRGVVEQVVQIPRDQAREVALIDRETPTKGKKLGFIEQILGNLGRVPGSAQ